MNKLEFDLGEMVYLITDCDQMRRIITAINISFGGVEYQLACGEIKTWHYEVEISRNKFI